MLNIREISIAEILGHSKRITASIPTIFFKVMIAIYVLSRAGWFTMANGLKSLSGAPLGEDFLNIYAAGLLVNRGQPAAAYDLNLHHQVEETVAGYATPYFTAWHHPPMFLAIAALCALAPYLWAFTLYMAASLGGYLAVMHRVTSRAKASLWMLAAFPGVYSNICYGQSGFITTALFGAGLLELEKRPWLAGALFGLMSYKPQFFVVIPLVLAVSGYGRALLATLATALASAALSWAVFGTATWQAFFGNIGPTQHLELEQGLSGEKNWGMMKSVFSTVRMEGGDVITAYALQAVVAAMALACAVWIWRRRATLATRASALCAGILLTSPYVLEYDLVILAVPLAFLTNQGMEPGLRPYEKVLLAALWILPVAPRSWGGYSLPLTPLLAVALMGLCLWRARRSISEPIKLISSSVRTRPV